MSFPTAPDAPVPHLAVNADLGGFAYAVSQMPPGKHYMAEGSTCSWTEYMRLWTRINNVPGSYEQVSIDRMVELSPDSEFGIEAGAMFAYSSDPGYGGGDRTLLKAEDLRKVSGFCFLSPSSTNSYFDFVVG